MIHKQEKPSWRLVHGCSCEGFTSSNISKDACNPLRAKRTSLLTLLEVHLRCLH